MIKYAETRYVGVLITRASRRHFVVVSDNQKCYMLGVKDNKIELAHTKITKSRLRPVDTIDRVIEEQISSDKEVDQYHIP